MCKKGGIHEFWGPSWVLITTLPRSGSAINSTSRSNSISAERIQIEIQVVYPRNASAVKGLQLHPSIADTVLLLELRAGVILVVRVGHALLWY